MPNTRVNKKSIAKALYLFVAAPIAVYAVLYIGLEFKSSKSSNANLSVVDKTEITQENKSTQQTKKDKTVKDELESEVDDSNESSDSTKKSVANNQEDSSSSVLGVETVQDVVVDESTVVPEPVVQSQEIQTQTAEPVQPNPKPNVVENKPEQLVEQPVVSSTGYSDEARAVELLNNERISRGLNPLIVVPAMSNSARVWSNSMAVSGVAYHATNLTEGVPDGYSGYGENIAFGSNVDQHHNFFMNSPVHRANMLKPEFTHVGIGVAFGGGAVWSTQRFATVI